MAEKIDPLDDGISSVELLWIQGNDLEVVNDARESYDKEHLEWIEPYDSNLVEFLAWNDHWTPFGGSVAKFRIKMPIFIIREWYRHQIGFNRNEVSRRYVSSNPEIYIPTQLRQPSMINKQASVGKHPSSKTYIMAMRGQMNQAVELYNGMILDGVAMEQARIVLPQGMYTEFRETASIYAYIHLCGLRLAPNVMPETRAYAQTIYDMLEPHFPVTFKTYKDRWEVITEALRIAYDKRKESRK